MRTLDEFNGRYDGETCFLIGAGASIHSQNMELLKNKTTIAVNSGYVALPDSTFFLSDDWSVAHWSYFFRDLRKSDSTIALLYDKMLKSQSKWFGDRSVFFRHRTGYHITDKYDHNNEDLHICQANSSVGSAIHVAHIMGFQKIVLLGIDCKRIDNYRYFWQYPSFKPKPYRNDGVPPDRYKKTSYGGHQSDTDLVSLFHYWQKVADEMKDKCDIYNASPHSILKVFPKVRLEEFCV